MGDRHRQRVGGVGAGDSTPGSRRWTMAWTCAFSAAPVPTTAFLTSRGGIFADVDPGAGGDHQHDAAGLAELERRLRVLVDEHFLDRGGLGRMVGDASPRAARRGATGAWAGFRLRRS